MAVMIVWRTVPGKYKAAIDAFISGGGPVPAGAKTLGRWHTPGSTLGWHLVDGEMAAVTQHVADWADLLEIEIYPVIDDEESAAGLTAALAE